MLIVGSNTGGGKPESERDSKRLGKWMESKDPDFVGCQELMEGWRGGRKDGDVLAALIDEMPNHRGYFVPTVESGCHPCPPTVPGTDKPGKWFNLTFRTYSKAAQGNGLIVRKDWTIVHLFTGLLEGPDLLPACIQISQPMPFEGDRETEPRCLILARFSHVSKGEVIVANLHLTKLRDEPPGGVTVGMAVRRGQIDAVDRVLARLRALIPEVPIFLVGDFNAQATLFNGQPPGDEFLPLRNRKLLCATDSYTGTTGTHVKDGTFIDHIWVWPSHTRQYRVRECHVLEGLEQATDHRPVVSTFEA